MTDEITLFFILYPASVFHGIFVASHSCTFCSLGIRIRKASGGFRNEHSSVNYAMPYSSRLRHVQSAFIEQRDSSMPSGRLTQMLRPLLRKLRRALHFRRPPCSNQQSFPIGTPGSTCPVAAAAMPTTCTRPTTAEPTHLAAQTIFFNNGTIIRSQLQKRNSINFLLNEFLSVETTFPILARHITPQQKNPAVFVPHTLSVFFCCSTHPCYSCFFPVTLFDTKRRGNPKPHNCPLRR